jgi:hypothetical protein
MEMRGAGREKETGREVLGRSRVKGKWQAEVRGWEGRKRQAGRPVPLGRTHRVKDLGGWK